MVMVANKITINIDILGTVMENQIISNSNSTMIAQQRGVRIRKDAPMLSSEQQNQITTNAVVDMARYSASELDLETLFCFLISKRSELQKNIQQLVMIHRISSPVGIRITHKCKLRTKREHEKWSLIDIIVFKQLSHNVPRYELNNLIDADCIGNVRARYNEVDEGTNQLTVLGWVSQGLTHIRHQILVKLNRSISSSVARYGGSGDQIDHVFLQ